MPLIDVAAPTKGADLAKAQAFVERNIKAAAKALEGFSSAFIDSSELDSDFRLRTRVHPLLVQAEALLNSGCNPIPVAGLHRDDAHMRAWLRARTDANGGLLCLRLDATDVGTASQTQRSLADLLRQHELDARQIVLVLDLQSVHGMLPEPLALQVIRFIQKVSPLGWKAYVVGGYGIPDQLSHAVSVRGQGYLPRVEQDVFERVKEALGREALWYADYTTVAPTHVELDWRIVSRVMSPKAIYALEQSWFVVRGSPFSTHADGYRQYHGLAREIIALEDFSGPNFSTGDAYIHECATDKDATTGSPGSWITACVNHHISLSAVKHA